MDKIQLRKKPGALVDYQVIVYDELISGMLTNELFVPVFSGAGPHGEIKLIPVSELVNNYQFPLEKNGEIPYRIAAFIKGYNPKLHSKIKFYKPE